MQYARTTSAAREVGTHVLRLIHLRPPAPTYIHLHPPACFVGTMNREPDPPHGHPQTPTTPTTWRLENFENRKQDYRDYFKKHPHILRNGRRSVNPITYWSSVY